MMRVIAIKRVRVDGTRTMSVIYLSEKDAIYYIDNHKNQWVLTSSSVIDGVLAGYKTIETIYAHTSVLVDDDVYQEARDGVGYDLLEQLRVGYPMFFNRA